ncbi:hypothetical protein AQUCO_01900194v1 [Aquilegia coerulea]|uniref:Uncharacterized protein n=1 Tax=Aquilegia coerulea TaxID=218851 RepID=A0A2G5DJI6_AQUCA|nr:hypothetical protein AQUCO_01900194v1 [Aquilegia coerulea]
MRSTPSSSVHKIRSWCLHFQICNIFLFTLNKLRELSTPHVMDSFSNFFSIFSSQDLVSDSSSTKINNVFFLAVQDSIFIIHLLNKIQFLGFFLYSTTNRN